MIWCSLKWALHLDWKLLISNYERIAPVFLYHRKVGAFTPQLAMWVTHMRRGSTHMCRQSGLPQKNRVFFDFVSASPRVAPKRSVFPLFSCFSMFLVTFLSGVTIHKKCHFPDFTPFFQVSHWFFSKMAPFLGLLSGDAFHCFGNPQMGSLCRLRLSLPKIADGFYNNRENHCL